LAICVAFFTGDLRAALVEDGEDCVKGLVRRNWHLFALPTILIYHHPYSESAANNHQPLLRFSFSFLLYFWFVDLLLCFLTND